MPSDTMAIGPSRERLVFMVKWGASAIQILGYTATGFGWTLVRVVNCGNLLFDFVNNNKKLRVDDADARRLAVEVE